MKVGPRRRRGGNAIARHSEGKKASSTPPPTFYFGLATAESSPYTRQSPPRLGTFSGACPECY